MRKEIETTKQEKTMSSSDTALLLKFEIGESAVLDAHKEGILVAVQAICYRGGNHATYEVAWIHSGINQEVWVADWRLTPIAQDSVIARGTRGGTGTYDPGNHTLSHTANAEGIKVARFVKWAFSMTEGQNTPAWRQPLQDALILFELAEYLPDDHPNRGHRVIQPLKKIHTWLKLWGDRK